MRTRGASGGPCETRRELTERELQIGPVVLDVGIAHQIEQSRVIGKNEAGEPLRLSLGAKRLPLGAVRWQRAYRPSLRSAFRTRNKRGVCGPLGDHQSPARESVKRDSGLRPIGGADDDEPSAPRRRGKRGREDPRVLIRSREHPEGVRSRGLESARVSKQLADITFEPHLGPDLHVKPMLATA
jgi:hypothetical protein